jgi:hypothetical protein
MTLSFALSIALNLAAAAPEGETLRVPVTRDTWVSAVAREADANLGGANRLKLKSIQEMSLIDVDPAPMRGHVVTSATLHLRSTGEPHLHRVTVGTVGAEWVEGTSPSYAPQAGSSSFKNRRSPDVRWTAFGGDLCNVILGQGGTIWRNADASVPRADGWQQVAIDPAVIAARVAGVGEGFLVFDDTGSEWSRDDDRFTLRLFPNRFVQSREAGPSSAPYLTVALGPEDQGPPAVPSDLRADLSDLPSGEARVSWTTPGDDGPAGTVGFFVDIDGRPAPRYLIPRAGRPGERATMHLRDLGLAAGAEVAVAVRAVDGAGNVGPPAEARLRVSDRVAAPLPGAEPSRTFADPAPLPRLGKAEVAVIDELDKVQPITDEMVPPQPDGYLAANHLWSARERKVRLHAARNEFVAFQVLVKPGPGGVRPSLTFEGPGAGSIRPEFGRYVPVASRRGALPDPIVPSGADGPRPLTPPASEAIHCELHVPHDVPPGEHEGTLTLRSGEQTLAIGVTLRVWDFTLPDRLSFLPEMNCYALPEDERAYYRLAHRHRTVLNRVPYSHSGKVAPGFAPGREGDRLSWTEWDRRFGPLLDGSAFADLPRRGVPIECFYLPLFENWPSPMEGNYNGDYWADRAFPESYRRAFVEASRQVAEHVAERGWADTFLMCFFNGKNNFKAAGWSRGTCPWLLDEPANFQDFWALRYFASAFHEGVGRVPEASRAKLVFRADISRPQWQRDTLDGLLDYNVVGSAMRTYHRIVMDRKEAEGQVVLEYGSTNPVEESNVQPVGWCLDAWTLGMDGVIPWQTIGRAISWTQGDPLSLFYPAIPRVAGPVPSIRLKAYRRGQQDVEYLTLLSQLRGEPRALFAPRVREALRLSAERRGTGATGVDDAGLVHFADLKPADAWALRVRVGQALSDLHPAPKARLVDLRTPPRRVP